MRLQPAPASDLLHEQIFDWYAGHARDLPWRAPDASSWGIFVSEVMLQQTPVIRVEPVWREWMQRWPAPADLAAATPAEVITAWGRLGYPRRALRLQQAAAHMVAHHDGQVPSTEAELLGLPGVGSYTAAAVATFAFGLRTTVVDTNIRRVLTRLCDGREFAPPSPTRAEFDRAAAMVPRDPQRARRWSVAAMELGALVCTARSPRCEQCPVRVQCSWHLAGQPRHDGPPRRGQAWAGTDRQVRGVIVQTLREARTPVAFESLAPEHDPIQVQRCLASLIEDGLVDLAVDHASADRAVDPAACVDLAASTDPAVCTDLAACTDAAVCVDLAACTDAAAGTAADGMRDSGVSMRGSDGEGSMEGSGGEGSLGGSCSEGSLGGSCREGEQAAYELPGAAR